MATEGKAGKKAVITNGEAATNRLAGVEGKAEQIVITPPRMEVVQLLLTGTAPLVQHRFGEKARTIMMEAQAAGSQSRKGKKREPKDFDRCFEEARHRAAADAAGDPCEPWDGIHAGGFRRAMIDACGLVGFHMTKGKKALFVVCDGYEADGTPLVRITRGQPRKVIHPARNASGVADLRARPMWDPGWQCVLTVRFDADLFSATDIVNLVARVGVQCGVGEGRANSKESAGCDWGFFSVSSAPE